MKEKKVSLSEIEKNTGKEKKSKKKDKKLKKENENKEVGFEKRLLSEDEKSIIYNCSRLLKKENVDNLILSTNFRSCFSSISCNDYFLVEEIRSFLHRTIHEMNKVRLPGESDVVLCFSRRENTEADFFFSKEREASKDDLIPINKKKGERVVMTFMGKERTSVASFEKVETEEAFVLKEVPSSVFSVSNEKLITKIQTPFGYKEVASHFSSVKMMKKKDVYARIPKEVYKKFLRREM